MALVITHGRMEEVYFIGGHMTGEKLSYLPGMERCNRLGKIKRFINETWRGVCGAQGV